MSLKGKGFFIWQIKNVEGGSPSAIAKKAQAAGLSHVLLKIADGNYPVNIDQKTGADLAPPVALSLHAKGIQVWGWHYVYGYDPVGEARIAVKRIRQMDLDGYAIDAEVEYKAAGRDSVALKFMHELRRQLGNNFPIALSSFRFPNYHRELPWKVFLDHCDYNMPQVYWLKAHNAGAQLRACYQQFQQIDPWRPIIPTGAAFKENGWRPTEAEIVEFLDTARALKLPAANFFSWDECYRDLHSHWDTIAKYSWKSGAPTPTPELDIVQKLFVALNTHEAAQIAKLYSDSAVLVSAERTITGAKPISQWHAKIGADLPDLVYSLSGQNAKEGVRHFTWKAASPKGQIQNGTDTIGILNDKIVYHYSYFTISPV